MKSFVNNKADNNARPQSANSNRRLAVGAQAKVHVPKANLRNEPVQIHAEPLRGSGNQTSIPPSTLQNDHRQDLRIHQNERYGTDAGSSIDTTIHERSSSLNKGEHQQTYQRRLPQKSGHDGDEVSEEDQQTNSEDDSDSDDGSGRNQDWYGDQVREQHLDQVFDPYHSEAVQEMKVRGMFHDEGNSYPTTTSGRSEEDYDRGSLRQQEVVNSGDYDRPDEPHAHLLAHGNTVQHTQPAIQWRKTPSAAPPNMPASNLFEKGATVRKSEQQVKVPLEIPGGGHRQTNVAAPDHVHSNDQAFPQVFHQRKDAPGQQVSAPVGLTPQREAPPPPARPIALPTKQASVANPALALRSTPPQTNLPLMEEPVVLYQSVEEEAPRESEDPIGDYDNSDLLDKTYDELRAEDFDHEPRGKTEVLSNDLQNLELKERLSHVQKNLGPADQYQFFRALPTNDWEDAGDWFLDRFGDIIKRVKAARQNKRKLARNFEDEVEKRYRRVAKRQKNVEAALDEMKEKGQGLIPKSPRASRAPVSKTPRSSKR